MQPMIYHIRRLNMSKLICSIEGVRGRSIEVFDNKCIITTNVTLGSLLTNNALDGEKTIFYIDVVGVQFKPSAITIGYLQLETSSMQMNNKSSNMFSENTFTFEGDDTMNKLMREVRDYIVSRIEGYKYGLLEQLSLDVPESLIALSNSINNPTKNDPMKPVDYSTLSQNRWICPSCGAGNAASKSKCYKCGKTKD